MIANFYQCYYKCQIFSLIKYRFDRFQKSNVKLTFIHSTNLCIAIFHKSIYKNQLPQPGFSYLVLAALTNSNIFKSAVSTYGIAELTNLAEESHKFEKGYNNDLIGKYPEEIEIFKVRSIFMLFQKNKFFFK